MAGRIHTRLLRALHHEHQKKHGARIKLLEADDIAPLIYDQIDILLGLTGSNRKQPEATGGKTKPTGASASKRNRPSRT